MYQFTLASHLSLLSCIVKSLIAPWLGWPQTPSLPSIELHGVAATLTVMKPWNDIDNLVEMTYEKKALIDTCISCKCLGHLGSFNTLRPCDLLGNRESCWNYHFHFYWLRAKHILRAKVVPAPGGLKYFKVWRIICLQEQNIRLIPCLPMNFLSSIAYIFLPPWCLSTLSNFCSHAYFISTTEE